MLLRPDCLVTTLIWGLLLFNSATAQSLTDSQVTIITQNLANGSIERFVDGIILSLLVIARAFHEDEDGLSQFGSELGYRAEAILEYYVPEFSIFTPDSLPPSASPSSNTNSALAPVFSIAHWSVGNLRQYSGFTNGPQPLMNDSTSDGPASLGIPVLLANWTGQTNPGQVTFAAAAQNQLSYMLNIVPRTSDGAISSQVDSVELWSNFVYSVPPFMAYYAALAGDANIMTSAYNQTALYRNYLSDSSSKGLWKHFVSESGGNASDSGHWSMGNALAAAGMCRVLATIMRSQFAGSMQSEQSDLVNWVKEIHSGMYPNSALDHLFRNYADRNYSPTNFYDAGSTALLASSVYRLSVLRNESTYVPYAELSRKQLVSSNIDVDGWLAPVVSSDNYTLETNKSAPAQAFVLEMEAARRDWVLNGSPGANLTIGDPASPRNSSSPSQGPASHSQVELSELWLGVVVCISVVVLGIAVAAIVFGLRRSPKTLASTRYVLVSKDDP